MRTLFKILRDADLEPEGYSGRGMYGKECLAVRGDSEGEILSKIVLRLPDGDTFGDCEQVARALREMKTDSMGRGIVVYFPHEPWVEPSQVDDE